MNWPCEELSCLSADPEELPPPLTDFQLLPQAPIHFQVQSEPSSSEWGMSNAIYRLSESQFSLDSAYSVLRWQETVNAVFRSGQYATISN